MDVENKSATWLLSSGRVQAITSIVKQIEGYL
jgi:hypothetical protein